MFDSLFAMAWLLQQCSLGLIVDCSLGNGVISSKMLGLVGCFEKQVLD